MSVMIHRGSTGKVLSARRALILPVSEEPRVAELPFHIQLQSGASNCADETSFPLICQCIGPLEWECSKWKRRKNLKLAEYEKEKWRNSLDITAVSSAVWLPLVLSISQGPFSAWILHRLVTDTGQGLTFLFQQTFYSSSSRCVEVKGQKSYAMGMFKKIYTINFLCQLIPAISPWGTFKTKKNSLQIYDANGWKPH